MFSSAKLSKWSFRFLVLNLLLVSGVAALRPVFATQEATGSKSPDPEVELPPAPAPADQPLTADQVPVDSAVLNEIPPSVSGSRPAPINPMVLDEIRKAIQDSRGELDVPPLSYPALPFGSARKSTQGNLDALAHRMKSIAALTQSAQALIKEAQHLESKGRATEAGELIEQVQTLKTMLVQLAADSSQTVSALSPPAPN